MRAALVVTLIAGCGRIAFDPSAPSTVAVDSTGASVVAASDVASIQLTTLAVGTGANECLVAGLALSNQQASAVTLQWNGAAMALVTDQATPGTVGRVFVARLIAPDRGSQTLTASWTGSSDAVLGAVAFSGADQTECVRAGAMASGTSAMPSVTVPSADGHVTMDVAVTTAAFQSATQTSRGLATAASRPRLVQQTTHAAPSATTDTCTLAAPPTPGNNLVFLGENLFGALQSVTGAGVTWQYATRSDGHSNVEIWYGEASTGTSATVTYTGQSTSSMVCWIGEFAGLATSGSLDATSASSGTTTPALPGPLATTTANDLLIVGYSAYAPVIWGMPTQGPWTALTEIDDANHTQLEFLQQVAAPGSWNPSNAQNSTGWDSAMAAFKASVIGIGGALSTAPGAASNTHAWSTDAQGFWASVGIDVFP